MTNSWLPFLLPVSNQAKPISAQNGHTLTSSLDSCPNGLPVYYSAAFAWNCLSALSLWPFGRWNWLEWSAWTTCHTALPLAWPFPNAKGHELSAAQVPGSFGQIGFASPLASAFPAPASRRLCFGPGAHNCIRFDQPKRGRRCADGTGTHWHWPLDVVGKWWGRESIARDLVGKCCENPRFACHFPMC